jgi:hypothetical protein
VKRAKRHKFVPFLRLIMARNRYLAAHIRRMNWRMRRGLVLYDG